MAAADTLIKMLFPYLWIWGAAALGLIENVVYAVSFSVFDNWVSKIVHCVFEMRIYQCVRENKTLEMWFFDRKWIVCVIQHQNDRNVVDTNDKWKSFLGKQCGTDEVLTK